jgi:diaminohydroxyphosphoribosylaminopyrimidine deaminase/5-amino-6-(5-phosphoribosylamino)uracil reductase
VFWECGGTLAAPAIASGVIHKVLAFVAPKIIGGARAPTPVGELGNVEMTQVRGWAVFAVGSAVLRCVAMLP